MTPETRDSYVAAKGGWIQTSVTISDMSIAAWTQQKQDMFIEAVAATAQVSKHSSKGVGYCSYCLSPINHHLWARVKKLVFVRLKCT